MKIAKGWWVLTFLLMPGMAAEKQATASAGDLHAEIQRVYNFQPHTLNSTQITQKSALLDEFWTKRNLSARFTCRGYAENWQTLAILLSFSSMVANY